MFSVFNFFAGKNFCSTKSVHGVPFFLCPKSQFSGHFAPLNYRRPKSTRNETRKENNRNVLDAGGARRGLAETAVTRPFFCLPSTEDAPPLTTNNPIISHFS